jgi:hypothetical protein
MPPDASKSDFELFKALANPCKTNFNKKSAVSRALDNEMREPEDRDFRHPPPSPPRSVGSEASGRSYHHRYRREPEREREREREHEHDREHDRDPEPDSMDHDNSAEKHAMLVELNSMKMSGVLLTRDFTMQDSVGDMRFELNRVRSNSAAADAGTFGTLGLGFFLKTVETANSRWGPVMHLDGLSQTVGTNSEMYKAVLTKLYKKHFRKGEGISPEMQLAMLLGGSTLATHWGNMSGKSVEEIQDMIRNYTPPSMKTPLKQNSPPHPPPTSAQQDDGGAFANRPTMRRPTPMPAPPQPQPQEQDRRQALDAEMQAMNQERMAWAEERAALQSQLRRQMNSVSPPIFMTGFHRMHGDGADIEILN